MLRLIWAGDSLAVVADDRSAAHDEFHSRERADVGEGIAGHRNDIGGPAGFDDSGLVRDSERLRGAYRRRSNRVDGRESGRDECRELARVFAVWQYTGVRPENDWHTPLIS